MRPFAVSIRVHFTCQTSISKTNLFRCPGFYSHVGIGARRSLVKRVAPGILDMSNGAVLPFPRNGQRPHTTTNRTPTRSDRRGGRPTQLARGKRTSQGSLGLRTRVQLLLQPANLLPQPPLPGQRFLGEGGKKRVYRTQDTTLDREVAFADLLLEGNGEGDRAKAVRLLDESLAISSELGMRPLMERVLSRREILRA